MHAGVHVRMRAGQANGNSLSMGLANRFSPSVYLANRDSAFAHNFVPGLISSFMTPICRVT